MLHSNLARHATAFGLIMFASIALYPAAKGEKTFLIWLLLAVIASAATLILSKK